MDTFVLLKFLAHLALPPASMAVGLVLAGVLALVGWRRLAKGVAALAVLQTLVLSLPPVGDRLLAVLQDDAVALARPSKPCCYDAIVVLGGAITPAAPPHMVEPSLTASANRLWETARLYHRGVAPRVIAAGGGFPAEGGTPSMTEAEAMRMFLQDLGVPAEAIVEEGKSRNTIENIAFVRDMVGDKPVALVTSATHMPRAMRLAQRIGLKASAFPAAWIAPADARPSWQNWMPTADALLNAKIALWELIALAFDRRGPGVSS